MGLIKTALVSGTAIYGINKIAKSYETHEAHKGGYPLSRQNYDQGYYSDSPTPPRRYQDGRSLGAHDDVRSIDGEMPNNAIYSKQGHASDYYQSNEHRYQQRPQYDDEYLRNGRDGDWRSVSAPPYQEYPRQQKQLGYTERQDGHWSERPENAASGRTNMLAPQDLLASSAGALGLGGVMDSKDNGSALPSLMRGITSAIPSTGRWSRSS